MVDRFQMNFMVVLWLICGMAPMSFAKDSDIPLKKNSSGAFMPNITLINQDGKSVQLFDDLLKGKIVLVNFIFTSCHDMCPMETARIKRVYDLIGDRMGQDVFFYSISIDPKVDTPSVLADYRRKFSIGNGWDFFTGNEEDITAARKRLGLFMNGIERVKSDHALEVLIGNEKTGQWMRRSGMDKAEVLAGLLKDRLSEYRYTNGVRNNFADAPLKINPRGVGKEVFETRCKDCHTVGGRDGIGPDLYRVTSIREKAWLQRWLTNPNEMVVSGDPIATAMVSKFKGLVMPNLSLSSSEIDEVLGFLAALDNEQGLSTSR